MENSTVLQNDQILQKTKRIAYQIHENTYNEEEVYIGGIAGTGYILAERIVAHLNALREKDVHLFEIKLNKKHPLGERIQISVDDESLKNNPVIVVDDVINSGKTMIYAVNRILENPVKILKIATLVNRTHRRYPVQADFVGLNIATTLQDNILVELGETNGAYLK
ncbi:MAG: phosphoribosyltransferase [Crocinitomicaceae bacterium]|nr:phosphoribosyltransferase [Crocinitomicaceae bacterium]